jgi:glycosyltransferase involved in cell wall biosynthesis
LILPAYFAFPSAPGQPGRDRPLRLGFVGKDWQRKGLPFLLRVRTELERMGMPAVVRCAGRRPRELSDEPGLDYVGFIDKAHSPGQFLDFLTDCDLGCLFSGREPLGISTLEFLRAGVPVAGFMVEGVADTVPLDAGFRFAPTATAAEVAAELQRAFQNPETVSRMRTNAQSWSPLVTWERCVGEWRELLATGTIKHPVQPWRGLAAISA